MNNWRVNLDSFEIGDDLLLTLTGGNKPHIGAIALAIPYKQTSSASLLSVYGHKDGEIAKPIAEKVSKKLHKNVVVIVGIHLDNATENDIKNLIDNSYSEVDKFLDECR
ncbi:MAG: proteasome assembly chaperone 4 family protein [Promethearchaeota archaeon]